MQDWKKYIIAIIGCCLISSVLSCIFSESRQKELIKLFSGIFIAVAILSPLTKVDFSKLAEMEYIQLSDTASVVAAGEVLAQKEIAARIISECEAYILDKAELLGAEIEIAITLNEELLPVFAEIQGNYTDFIRLQVESILENDLGITKENQLWTGKQENSRS